MTIARRYRVALAILVSGITVAITCWRTRSHTVDVRFVVLERSDEGHGNPVPCRVHLRNERGDVWTAPGAVAFDDHFVFGGSSVFPMPIGRYTYDVERGPEYRALHGSLRIEKDSPRSVEVRLERMVDMAARGWYSGDLHIHRNPADMPVLMEAEDLHVGPVITWWNSERSHKGDEGWAAPLDRDRIIDPTGGEDERVGGALLYFRLGKALDLPHSIIEKNRYVHREGDERDEFPSPADFASLARRQPSAHIDIEKPFWLDMPTWVALGLGDSIGIAHNHMDRSMVHMTEAWGKQRDLDKYGKGPQANGYWTQDIYYRLLEAGLRLAPSAGSASGAIANPVGYDRVYVYLGAHLEYAAWWSGLKAGHSFVTNGPLLIVSANGRKPGEVFRAPTGDGADRGLDVRLDVFLVSNDRIASVEIIRDGQVSQKGSFDPATGVVTFAPEHFGTSGWFLVRAITDLKSNFRFASTAPFYVEIGPNPRRVSRKAAEFFVTWVRERVTHLREGFGDSPRLPSVLAPHLEAERFWQQQARNANAD